MKIHIVLPYDGADELLYTWANEEKKIDFRKEPDRAARCTISYAATEIVTYLEKLNHEVSFSNKNLLGAVNIYLETISANADPYGYVTECVKDGIRITATGREGVLYGAYDFLKLQGIRWVNPDYEVIPENDGTVLNLPKEKIVYIPDMPLGRGFDFEGLLKDSTKLWQWMARNKMNLTAYRPYTAAFQKKIGMIFRMGGHIFERILNPDKKTEKGTTLWEEHNDWYGVDPKKERCKENALRTQFCMSNEDLLNYLGEALIDYLNNDWYEADIIDLWTFDTWGSSCQCERCKKLGNGSDKTLYFTAHMRKMINKAVKDGRLDHDVVLASIAYEGNGTIDAPLNKVPEILNNGKDYVTFAPILRCYEHTLDDKACKYNIHYGEALEGWGCMPILFCEYYNVSKFEDLPLLFTKTMQKDIQYYKSVGVKGMTYMHLPMIEWGIKNLTQVIYAQLCSDVNADVKTIIDEYMINRYADVAGDMEKVYALCGEASAFSASWRSWGIDCVLSRLRAWNGEKPTEPFAMVTHLENSIISEGEKNINCLAEALALTKKCRNMRICNYADRMTPKTNMAVNPVEMQAEKKDGIVAHLDEDIRGIIYGLYVMKLTVAFVKYYNMLYNNENTTEVWAEIEKLTCEMAERYMPIKYINSQDNIELRCEDLLERSQLRELYMCCVKYRQKNKDLA